MKNSLLLFFSTLIMCSTFAQKVVTISPNVEHQKIDGWGVSLAWWANLAGGMPQSSMDELANYAVNDLNFNVFRFNIAGGENPNCTEGDHIRKDGGKMPGYRGPHADGEGWGTYDLSNDFRQIKVMNKLAELRQSKGDIITEMVSYSPPWWMTHGQCSAGHPTATSENLKPEFIDDFADYLASVTAGLMSTYPSWNIKYIEPFNEPISGYWKKGGKQEGCAFYPSTQAQVLWRLWQRKQAYNIGHVGLVSADNSKVQSSISNLNDLKNDHFNEFKGLSKINTHSYSGTWQDKATLGTFAKDNGNIPIWQSETGPLGWTLPTGGAWFQRHYDMAYRLIEDLRNLKSTVWCDWQMMSIDDGWGMVQQTNWDENDPYKKPTFKKTRGYFIRKNFSYFIKSGYQIVGTNDGNTIGALSPDKSEFVLVLLNRAETGKSYELDLNNFSSVAGFKTYRTSGGDNSLENTTEKVANIVGEKGVLSGKKIIYNAPAFSVTTFVVDLSEVVGTEGQSKKQELVLYPNPAGEVFNVIIPANVENGQLIICNQLGLEIRTIDNVQTGQIQIEGLENGAYLYKLSQGGVSIAIGNLMVNR